MECQVSRARLQDPAGRKHQSPTAVSSTGCRRLGCRLRWLQAVCASLLTRALSKGVSLGSNLQLAAHHFVPLHIYFCRDELPAESSP